jgi:hypothetical protein
MDAYPFIKSIQCLEFYGQFLPAFSSRQRDFDSASVQIQHAFAEMVRMSRA